MRKFASFILAAILGSLITLGGYQLLQPDAQKVVYVNDATESQAVVNSVTTSTSPAAIVKTPSYASATALDFTQAAEKTTAAVVHIKASRQTASKGTNNNNVPDVFRDFFGDDFFFGPNQRGQRGQQGPSEATGSGVILSRDGYIVTNDHVIKGAGNIEVVLSDKRSFQAKIVGTDPSTDLALLKIEGENLQTLNYGDSDAIKVGEWVLAVGNPFNLASTVTAGIVSAKARNINILEGSSPVEAFIQTDAAVNPGNSGGALVDMLGNLVGINSAIATPTGSFAGYSFAIPAKIVEKVVMDLKEYGLVQRGFIGVQIVDLDGTKAKELDLDISSGAYVAGLMENGAAAQAGIKEGDVILKVDNTIIHSSAELQEAVARKRPGDRVGVTINRGGKNRNMMVTLRNKDGNTDIIPADSPASTKGMLLKDLGVELDELTKTEREKVGRGGVKISRIYRGLISASTDIESGFVITHIDGKSINSINDITSVLNNKKGGVLMEGVYLNEPSTSYYYGFGM